MTSWAMLAEMNWWLMAWDLNPAWKGGHGGAEETAGVLAVTVSKNTLAQSALSVLAIPLSLTKTT